MAVSKDVISGIVILAACAVLYYITTTFESDPLGAAQGMPATHMPQLILVTISALALIMIVQGARAGAEEKQAPPPLKMWVTAAILGLAAVLFPVIGVPITFFAVCVALPTLWGARNYLAVGVFAVSVPIAIFIVFQILLGLRLPLGPLSGLVV